MPNATVEMKSKLTGAGLVLQLAKREGGIRTAPERPHARVKRDERFLEVVTGNCGARGV
jgi:hypothetical protein